MMSDTVSKQEFLAILSILVKRATLMDRWRAYRRPGHWLNSARRELLIERGN